MAQRECVSSTVSTGALHAMSRRGRQLEGSFSPTETSNVLNLNRPRGRLANRCIRSTVGMLCPAAPSMMVPTVAMMSKKKTAPLTAKKASSKKGRHNLRNSLMTTNENAVPDNERRQSRLSS